MSILNDGYQTLIDFADFPSVNFKEKEVTPPGVIGGGPNDTTTMRNETWRTQQPKFLKSLGESGCVVAYDPQFLEDAVDMVNVNQLITITFPDGSTYAFWGWLDEFQPNAHKEGEQPTANVKILPSNQDADGNETAPVFTAAA
jgi:hypothetical protein